MLPPFWRDGGKPSCRSRGPTCWGTVHGGPGRDLAPVLSEKRGTPGRGPGLEVLRFLGAGGMRGGRLEVSWARVLIEEVKPCRGMLIEFDLGVFRVVGQNFCLEKTLAL